MNSSRSFLKRLMIVYMILLVGVALTNYIIDPYFCYRESSMENISHGIRDIHQYGDME